ncbi:MAG: hypothetical protein OXN18_03740 [Gemmatimonadota bacterium]|nr:hypothetical protein [Gemmatimonadota bacterium]
MTRARRMLWVPALFVGTSLAIAIATGAAVLLYDAQWLVRGIDAVAVDPFATGPGGVLDGTQGLLRALAVLLGVATVSLIAGLWVGNGRQSEETVPAAARGWVGFLVALLLGAGFTAVWEAMAGFEGVALAQGAGLAFTAALPAYFAGGVLGRLGGFAAVLETSGRRQVRLGGLLGAVVGSVLAGTYLGRPVLAVTAFLGATVLAAAGARFQGWIFDRVPRRRLVLHSPDRPELRFEAWHTLIPEKTIHLLLEGERDLAVDRPPAGDWRLAVESTLTGDDAVFFVGAASWSVQPDRRPWTMYEPDAAVRALAHRGFGWDDDRMASSLVPEQGGLTVVAEWEALRESLAHSRPLGELLCSLRDAEIKRAWIRGSHGRLPDSLADAGLAAGMEVFRYVGTMEGSRGPPHLAPRRDELWCFSRAPDPPGPLPGMKSLSLPAQMGDGGQEGPA